MASSSKGVPGFITISSKGTEAWCTVCSPHAEDWIQKSSLRNHLKSKGHLECVNQRAAQEARMSEINDALSREDRRRMTHPEPRQLAPVNIARVSITQDKPQQKMVSAQEDELWNNFNAASEEISRHFDAGDDPAAAAIDAERRWQQQARNFVLGLWDSGTTAADLGIASSGIAEDIGVGDQDETDEILSTLLENAQLDDFPLEEAVAQELGGESSSTADTSTRARQSVAWAPYESKTMFLLDTIDNLPRLRVSDALMRVFIWILRETGARDVPSLDRLRKVQQNLRQQCGVPMIQCKSPFGNVFFMNDIRTIIAQDWANPMVRPHIHVYPEVPSDAIREVWHANKWREDMDLDALSPMWVRNNKKHYYVNELAELKNGELVIPFRWVVQDGKVYADAWAVSVDNDGIATVHDSESDWIAAEDLRKNFYDLEHDLPYWDDRAQSWGYPSQMPNPLRELAQGDPLYTSFIDYFGDDVSGNRSKSWNKHWNAYITHRNLPRALLQQEFHMHFVSTSPHATIPEQFVDCKKVIESTHTKPVVVRDAATGQNTRFRIFANAEPSDNPMQSEVSGHIGSGGNLYCRKCMAGGPMHMKESDAGFHSLFEPGAPRTKEGVLAALNDQVRAACSGVEKRVTELQTATGVKDAYTQHWVDQLIQKAREMRNADRSRPEKDIEDELLQWVDDNKDTIFSPFFQLKGFDPTKDTPVEILHTIALGIIKYAWHGTYSRWNAETKSLFGMRLQATDVHGLSVQAIRANYIMQYANSLIGRQLKTVAQTMVFHIHDLVPPSQFQLWLAVGELTALLWFPEVDDQDEYLEDLDVAVSNVLDAFAEVDPSKIVHKIKIHLQTHIRYDFLRFGPLLGAATEGFESFNGVFRYCSIYSNHVAPSRDIAKQLAAQESYKHRITGGYWPVQDSENDEWDQSGAAIRDYLQTQPVLQRLIGWTRHEEKAPGTSVPITLKKGEKSHTVFKLSEALAQGALNFTEFSADSRWIKARSFIAQTQEECRLDCWVFAKSSLFSRNALVVGKIVDILAPTSSDREAIAILDIFEVASERHPIYKMPYVYRRQGELSHLIVLTKDVQFMVNVQHDCISARCTASGKRAVMQERTESGVIERYWEHKYSHSDRFVLNMHSLHNPHLLRRALRPQRRALTAPIPIYPDRWKQHCEQAKRLREINDTKREKARQAQASSKAAGKKRKKPTPTARASAGTVTTQNPANMWDNFPPALSSDEEDGQSDAGACLDEEDGMLDEPIAADEHASGHAEALVGDGSSFADPTISTVTYQSGSTRTSRSRKRQRVE